MVRKVAIVTDTVASLPSEILQKYDVSVVPFHIIRGGKDLGELDVDKEQFRVWNKDKENLPMTSAPSIGEIVEIWHKLALRGYDILHIAMSSRMGMEHSIALQARSLVQGELPNISIEVIDSFSAQAGEMFVVLEAAKAAGEGKVLADVKKISESMVERVSQFYLLDTLYNLVRGGRGDRIKIWEGAALSMKAILELGASTQGVMAPLARVRTRAKGIEQLIEVLKERVGNKKLHAGITIGDIPDEARTFKERLMSQFQIVELFLLEGSIVADVHDGPAALRLGFYSED